MSHLVICTKCGKRFDRDSVQAVKTSARRYAHAECDPDNKDFVPLVIKEKKKKKTTEKAEDPDRKALFDYIKKVYGQNANYALINKQIKEYQNEYNYTLSGILKSLVYWYDVKANSPDQSNGGIGIVPFIYQQAYNYYYSLFVAKNQNKNKNIKQIISKVREVVIPLPKVREKKRMFNVEIDERNE